MKKWVEKLIEQFDFEWSGDSPENGKPQGLNDDRATLLFLLDIYNKHLLDVEDHPVRKVRETLDTLAKDLISPKDKSAVEQTLFKTRQFFSTYRIDETTYVQKTFEELRTIIWDFVSQLSDDMGQEQKDDLEIKHSLNELKEAVESNSLDDLKTHSRKFIDYYLEKQVKKDKRRSSRMKSIRKNLTKMKQQLGEVSTAAITDHLTGAYNRKAFDEQLRDLWGHFQTEGTPMSLVLVDIDHFKRINDTFGHPVGDFVLKELVSILKNQFSRDADFVGRIGGEEFAILMPEYTAPQALKRVEDLLARVRQEVFVQEQHQIRFTVSSGIAQLVNGESFSDWLKRADEALYNSKNKGRNCATLAPVALKAA